MWLFNNVGQKTFDSNYDWKEKRMARGNFQKAGNQRQKKVSADKIVKYVIKKEGGGEEIEKWPLPLKRKKGFLL